MSNNLLKEELPLGFGLALAQNTKALMCFTALSPEEQKKVIDNTKKVNSKAEMRDYVNSLITM